MKCPDCGAALSEVPLAGRMGHAMRCGRCGGWWTDAGIVNETTTAELLKWPGKMIAGRWASMGEEKCPRDGQALVKFTGESVPLGVAAKRCTLCGWWWWAGDELYRFKPAQEAKINYFQAWGKAAGSGAWLLPLASMVVILTSLIVGVLLVQQRQQVAVPAMQNLNYSN